MRDSLTDTLRVQNEGKKTLRSILVTCATTSPNMATKGAIMHPMKVAWRAQKAFFWALNSSATYGDLKIILFSRKRIQRALLGNSICNSTH